MSFNLNEEVIDGHLVTTETKKLWAVEMDLAKKLLEVCKKHNLKIWATDGTLLGAVRHKGFIPWDDDMDFVMMRDDYEKLIEIGPVEFEEPYFFQSFYTDEHSWGGVTKLRRSNTAMIEKDYYKHKDFNRGIFIDILVMDAIPSLENVKFRKSLNKAMFLRRFLRFYEMSKPQYLSPKLKIIYAFTKLFFLIVNPVHIHNKIKNILSRNRISDNENCGLLEFYVLERRDFSKWKLRSKYFFEETIFLPFHDMQLPVPKGYDGLLKLLYNDYMKPIKGTQTHSNIFIDCAHSYKEVLVGLKRK